MNSQNASFMILIFLIGILITIASWGVDNQLKDKACTSTKLKNSNQTVRVIGLTFIVSAVSYFICVFRCNCDDEPSAIEAEEGKVKLALYGYLLFLFVSGIILIVSGSIIENEAKGECKDAEKHSYIIWRTGLALAIGSFLIGGFKVYTQYNTGVRGKSMGSLAKFNLKSRF